MNCQTPTCQKEIPYKQRANNVKYCEACRKDRIRAYQIKWHTKNRLRLATPGDDKIECVICHGCYRQVGTHIRQAHKMTAREYRKQFGFDLKRGQLAEEPRKIRASYPKETGTVENLKEGKKFRFKKGDKQAGKYERQPETLERLRFLYKLNKNNK